jgi:hypothetical protein
VAEFQEGFGRRADEEGEAEAVISTVFYYWIYFNYWTL